ncbi:MAG: type II toxin-antitoxin system Phd/YefM family antitoxin [Pseudomonadota bacterium]
MKVNMHEAKTNLSKLVKKALEGEEVIIARSGHAAVRLVPLPAASRSPRVPGLAKGTFRMSPGFEAPLTDREIEEFLGA